MNASTREGHPAATNDSTPAPDAVLMHPDLAANWSLWSGVVSQAALTRLRHLEERFPELTTAVLSTADGLHIASVGTPVRPEIVWRR
jgi:hypothetical protein